MPPLHRRRRILAAAALFLPTPLTHATLYNLANQTLSLNSATYTADDTLSTTNVTITSSLSTKTLPASLNLLAGTTILNNSGSLTLTGPLSGTATLLKSGTGSLTLSAPSPSFTGAVTLNSATTTKLTDPLALGPASAPTPISMYGTIDISAAIPIRPMHLGGSASILANNSATPVTLGPDLSASIKSNTSFTLGGTGDFDFALPLPTYSTYLYKSGTGTLTYSTSTTLSYGGNISVQAGTLKLGVANTLNGAGTISVGPGASLDLNGFALPTSFITVAPGASVVNNNTSATATISSSVGSSPPNIGGAGNINLTRPLSFTKVGTGSVYLSASATTFSGSIKVQTGTVVLNAPNALGATGNRYVELTGDLDLNGYALPSGGEFYLNGGVIKNNNTTTPSTVNLSAVNIKRADYSPYMFGGDGEVVLSGPVGTTLYRIGGNGTLTLPAGEGELFTTVNVFGGVARLRASYANSKFIVYGNSQGNPFRAGVIDLNGLDLSRSIDVTLHNNAGFVNNNTATPATFNQFINLLSPGYSVWPPDTRVLGGDGTLIIGPTRASSFVGRTINKIGAGLLLLPAYFTANGFNLRGGTLQAEEDAQLGGPNATLAFLGGTLRVAPYALPAQSSYVFSSNISLDPANGTIETTRPSTLTGAFSGTGTLTKTGTASLTLAQSPTPTVALNVSTGTLLFAPTLPSAAAASLSISPSATVDLRSTSLTIASADPASTSTLRDHLLANRLTSSTPDPTNTHSLAYLQTGPSLLIQLTLTGDANLDGLLNADDYTLLDRSLAVSRTNALWTDGDFNYDGIITNQDYRLLDANYAQQQGGLISPALLSLRESQFGPEYVSTLLTSIPEPAALFFLCSPLPSLLLHRPRPNR